MAKVFAPGLSLDAHGSVGKSITFQKRPKGNAIMKPPRPPRSALDNPSAAQQKQRNLIGSIIKLWQESPQSSKDWWNDQARLHRPGVSGYHYFVQELTRNNYNDPALKLFLKLDEGGGCTARDSSHNGNDGTLLPDCPTDAPKYVVDAGITVLEFDGVNDNVLFPAPTYTNKLAVVGWITGEDPNSANDNVWIGFDNGNFFIGNTHTRPEGIQGYIRTAGETNYFRMQSSGVNMNDGNFHRVAFIYDGEDSSEPIKVWLDNVKAVIMDGLYPYSASGNITQSSNIKLGSRYGGSYWWDGKNKYIKLMSRILSSDEVLASYNYEKYLFSKKA